MWRRFLVCRSSLCSPPSLCRPQRRKCKPCDPKKALRCPWADTRTLEEAGASSEWMWVRTMERAGTPPPWPKESSSRWTGHGLGHFGRYFQAFNHVEWFSHSDTFLHVCTYINISVRLADSGIAVGFWWMLKIGLQGYRCILQCSAWLGEGNLESPRH